MNARRQAARAQILRAAADLFRERGYQASTLDHIAARLGMSKASLYTHFRAKDEMLATISRETIEAFSRDLSLVLASRLDPAEKLRRVVRQHVRFVIANRSFLTVFFGEEANLPPRFARSLAAQKDRYDKGVERIVAEGVRSGAFRDVPPRLVVFGLLGMVNWVHKWYNPAGRWGAASPRPRAPDARPRRPARGTPRSWRGQDRPRRRGRRTSRCGGPVR